MRIQFTLFSRRTRRNVRVWLNHAVFHLESYRAVIRRYLFRIFHWAHKLAVFLLWMSLEAPIRSWQLGRPVRRTPIEEGKGLRRALFCVGFSLTLVQLALLFLPGLQTSVSLWLLCAMHGLSVHLIWEKGTRWCRRQLGLRPSRSYDPKNPYAGLDLGN